MESISKSEYKWYAVYTKPRNEKKVVKELSIKGITNYCPLIKTLRQWSDRKKMVEEPLFRSYIFVNVSETEYYDAINTLGVVKYVTFGGKAVSIPENQIDIIKRTLNQNIDFEVSTKRFKKGEKIEVLHGSLAGLKGEIQTVSGKKTLLIRIDNIGYSLLVHIPQSNLKLTA